MARRFSVHAPLPKLSLTAKNGDRIGPYQLLGAIGAGGMGSVFLASRADSASNGTSPSNSSIPNPGEPNSSSCSRERAILAQLDHPHIARLFDAGTTPNGCPYFVMEHIGGASLVDFCATRKLDLQARLRLFQTVCAAVQYAHQHLVVHRDLKPNNILVTEDGKVKLVDFGLAKLLASNSENSTTLACGLALTPQYASPEQVRNEPASTLGDVYSLGVILYELLTGIVPFSQHTGIHALLRAVCEEEPVAPSVVGPNRLLRGDLDTIVLKAMHKEPERRYQSAEQLSDDIGHYLDGRPVKAQKDTFIYRARKFVNRHKVVVAAVILVLASLLGGTLAATQQARMSERERQRAEREAFEAQRLRTLAEATAARAQREQANAERRLAQLQKLARRVQQIYSSTVETGKPLNAALIAETARDSVRMLQGEGIGIPGLNRLLDQTSAAAYSFQLAHDAAWRVPPGWSAQETHSHEYRVGIDQHIVNQGKSSLFFVRWCRNQPEGSRSPRSSRRSGIGAGACG